MLETFPVTHILTKKNGYCWILCLETYFSLWHMLPAHGRVNREINLPCDRTRGQVYLEPFAPMVHKQVL